MPDDDHSKLSCPSCGVGLDSVTMDKLILDRMNRRREEMLANKEHLTDYSGYAILGELIKIFTNLEIDHQKESLEEVKHA